MSRSALPLSKFYAHRIERRHVYTLAQKYRHLRYGWSHPRVLTWIKEVLHATKVWHCFHATCYISIPEGIFTDKPSVRSVDMKSSHLGKISRAYRHARTCACRFG